MLVKCNFILMLYNFCLKKNLICIYIVVGPRGLQSGPNSIWAQGPCRGGILPKANDQWPRQQGERLKTYPVLGIPELQWEDQHHGVGNPQTAPSRGCERNGAHREAGCEIEPRKMRPLFSKCTCQYPEMINEKRRLDGVNFGPCN